MKAGHVILIGFMGAGKSSVGEALAARLELALIDTDARVEEGAGMSVAEIFRREGEEAFRDRESEVIRGLSGEEPGVVACGGGAVLRPDNVEALRRSGEVFYLRVSAGEALRRLADDDARPLLGGPAGRCRRVEALLEEREPLYLNAADRVIETVGREAAEVAEEIARIWRGSA